MRYRWRHISGNRGGDFSGFKFSNGLSLNRNRSIGWLVCNRWGSLSGNRGIGRLRGSGGYHGWSVGDWRDDVGLTTASNLLSYLQVLLQSPYKSFHSLPE